MRLLTTLLLMLCLTGAFAQTDSLKRERKVTFGISVAPVFYYDVKTISKGATWHAFNIAHPPQTASLGAHVMIGPAIKKRFYPSLAVGAEAWSDKIRMPVYLDFGMNMLKTRFTPYYHVSLGYLHRFKGDGEGNTEGIGKKSFLTGIGLGFSAAVAKHFAVTVCADYRFVRYGTYTDAYGHVPSVDYEEFVRNYIHQAGLRLLLTFH